MVLNIAGKIEEILEAFPQTRDGHFTIEVEGRLGTLKDGERLRLPVDSEIVLDPPSESLPYRFEAGLDVFRFQRLLDAVHDALQIPPQDDVFSLPPDTRVFQVDPIWKIETEDEFRDVSASVFEHLGIPGDDNFAPRRVRATYDRPRTHGAPPRELIWKRRIHVLNIYTGRGPDADGGASVDLRVGINLEYSLPLSVLQEPSRPADMMRRRDRTSYPLRNKYRLDATVVRQAALGKQQYHQSAEPTYEFEVEMNPVYLMREVEKKRDGQPHHLYRLIKDFLGILRDATAFLNSSTQPGIKKLGPEAQMLQPRGAILQELANLADCAQSQKALGRYLIYVSPVVPLIGDYLFRAVATDREELKADRVTPADVAESTKVELADEEVRLLRDTVHVE